MLRGAQTFILILWKRDFWQDNASLLSLGRVYLRHKLELHGTDLTSRMPASGLKLGDGKDPVTSLKTWHRAVK